ncbi:MAG: methylmalonyl Co-A mutase-associated GTPase MeaB [Betaproteobacteria bacterium]
MNSGDGNARRASALARILDRDRRAIGHAISAVENDGPGAAGLSAAVTPHAGAAHVLGITGPPGAGKSTLINALLGELIRRGKSIAVVAVDPSSPLTGGAVLGDRVRMGEHGTHPDVFIRSVSSRGHLGGLSRTTSRIVDILDAAGFDVVIVETVGAGQSEVEITAIADTRVVVCPPGLGDDVQAIKAGIFEIADVFVVNKGDLPAAEATVRDLKDMLRLRRRGAQEVPVIKTTATLADGVAAVVDAVSAHGASAGYGRRLRAPRPSINGGADGTEAAKRVLRLGAREPFGLAMGLACVEGGPGRAVVMATVGPQHLNFNGTCHGGMLFTLADTAFGLASNSHGMIAAGIGAHIAYHVAARAGDVLTATAVEVSRSRKLAVYRVEVHRADATLIASFTGTVYVTTVANEPQDVKEH